MSRHSLLPLFFLWGLLSGCYDKIEISSAGTGDCSDNEDYVLDLELVSFSSITSIWLSDQEGERVVEDYTNVLTPSPAFFNYPNPCENTYTFHSGTTFGSFGTPSPGTLTNSITTEEIHEVPSGLSLSTDPFFEPLFTNFRVFFNPSLPLTILNCPPIDSFRVTNIPEFLSYDIEYDQFDQTLTLIPTLDFTIFAIEQPPFVSIRSSLDGTWRGWQVVEQMNTFIVEQKEYEDMLLMEEKSCTAIVSEEGPVKVSFYSNPLEQEIELGEFEEPTFMLPVPIDNRTFIYHWTDDPAFNAMTRLTIQSTTEGWAEAVDLSPTLSVADVSLSYPELSWEASGALVLECSGFAEQNGGTFQVRRNVVAPTGEGVKSITLGSFSRGLSSEHEEQEVNFINAASTFNCSFIRYPNLTGGYLQYLNRVQGFSAGIDEKLLLDFERYETRL